MKKLIMLLLSFISINIHAQIVGTWQLDSTIMVVPFKQSDGSKITMSMKTKLFKKAGQMVDIGTIDNPILRKFSEDGMVFIYRMNEGLNRPELVLQYKREADLIRYYDLESGKEADFEVLVYVNSELLILCRFGGSAYYYYSKIR